MFSLKYAFGLLPCGYTTTILAEANTAKYKTVIVRWMEELESSPCG